MTRRIPLALTLALGAFALVSCRDDTTPTEPQVHEESPAPSDLAFAINNWTTKADMPTPRWMLTAGVVNTSSGSVVYAIGGLSDEDSRSRHSLTTVEAYSVATNTWTTKAALPVPLHHTNGTGLIGGKLYVSGGETLVAGGDLSEYSKTLYVYDPRRDTWTRKADMPRPISKGITAVIGGKLYVLTGECAQFECTTRNPRRLWRYDPATNRWDTSLRSSPAPHSRGAGGVIDGKFYVVGGGNLSDPTTNRLHVYDPATDKWTERAPLPTSRYGMAGVVLGGKFYVIGGIEESSATWVKTVHVYNPATNRWTTKASMPTGRTDLAAVRVLLDGQPRILAIGGKGGAGATKANEAYTP